MGSLGHPIEGKLGTWLADGFKGRPRVSQNVTLGALFGTISSDFAVVLVPIAEVFLKYSRDVP